MIEIAAHKSRTELNDHAAELAEWTDAKLLLYVMSFLSERRSLCHRSYSEYSDLAAEAGAMWSIRRFCQMPSEECELRQNITFTSLNAIYDSFFMTNNIIRYAILVEFLGTFGMEL